MNKQERRYYTFESKGHKWTNDYLTSEGAWGDTARSACRHRFTVKLPGMDVYLGSVAATTADTAHLDLLIGLGEVLDDTGHPIQIYVPWADYSPLTRETAHRLALLVNRARHNGQTIGLFCFGGHGRTGTAAAYLMGRQQDYGTVKALCDDLRGRYCSSAIESSSQRHSLATLLGLTIE